MALFDIIKAKGMKRISLFALACFASIGVVDAAVRDGTAVNRASGTTQPTLAASRTQSMAQKSISTRAPSASRTTSARTAASTNTRTASPARAAASATSARNASNTVVRTATTPRTNSTVSTAQRNARAATATKSPRAAITMSASQSQTFGTGYNACRDAYFTCMDQFCAKQNDTYRRCVCSSRLTEIQSRERALSQTSDQLQDFKDLNIEVIPKTGAEVKAMLTASEGEKAAATSKDTSNSAKQLSGISDILSKAKSKSLSTQGTLDIAGDINAIWATTDLTSGANIANLTGEQLYNAVHAQCAEMVSNNCASTSTLNMVVSAYGMYIENDCMNLINALDKRLNAANGAIRDTEREMNLARLENYNAHNSTSINDCIAQVRSDITADTACGKDYVHCLDVSGRYLNRDTGEPIYTADFYQLNGQISLAGDILNNSTNRMIVAELNRKRSFAARGLETCRDLADEVWDEFMRQAITEIYQGQQSIIRQVKTDCLDVVNACYDEQSQSLKDFSDVKEQLLLGSRLELSEQLCQEKLDACSNLYGNGTNGMKELLEAMHNITDQKIAKQCRVTLAEYAKEMCAVPSNDSLHSYPYACRVYAPGEQQYATNPICNKRLQSEVVGDDNTGGDSGGNTGVTPPPITGGSGYSCPTLKKYTSCKAGYYMSYNGSYYSTPRAGNTCAPCPSDSFCAGGTSAPIPKGGHATIEEAACGVDYIGSLYQKLVRYALQACVRPSDANQDEYVLPTNVLEDVNVVMDSIRIDMSKSLSQECDRLGGTWVDTQWVDEKTEEFNAKEGTTKITNTPDGLHDKTYQKQWKRFYTETSANTKWGFCAEPEDTTLSSQKDTCQASCGTWQSNNTCSCANVSGLGSGTWNTLTNRCEFNTTQKQCTDTGGQWNGCKNGSGSNPCTCTGGASWDTAALKCTCPASTKWNAEKSECVGDTPSTEG